MAAPTTPSLGTDVPRRSASTVAGSLALRYVKEPPTWTSAGGAGVVAPCTTLLMPDASVCLVVLAVVAVVTFLVLPDDLAVVVVALSAPGAVVDSDGTLDPVSSDVDVSAA